SLVLKVMAGDTVSLGARAFYKSIGNKQPKTQTPAADMAVALVQAFGGTATTDAHASAGQSGITHLLMTILIVISISVLKKRMRGISPR
ncbi:hypothetical protein MKQ70_00005, partial [Chitinophaga sedimenti]|uniref:hypothetical protein n=1 Tax=Chitinophaga sedimenti TaxID=2033606 RepID=UPI0020059748